MIVISSSPGVVQVADTASAIVPMSPKKVARAASVPPHELSSAFGFSLTLERLTNAIEGGGMKIFARIDHQAEAAAVGLKMPPTAVLIYGNPRAGTPLMQDAPSVALDLPLRILVRESANGIVLVSFHSGISIVNDAGLGDEYAANLIKAEKVIAEAIMP